MLRVNFMWMTMSNNGDWNGLESCWKIQWTNCILYRFNSSKGRTSKNYYESLVQTFSTKPLSDGLQKEKAYLFFSLLFHCPSCWGSFTKGKRRGHGLNYSTNRLFLPINIFFAHLPLSTCWKYKASNKLLIRNKGLDFTFE